MPAPLGKGTRILPETSRSTSYGLLTLDTNDKVDAGEFHAFRQGRKTAELHCGHGHIGETATLDIVEVIVRRCIRVEPGALAVDTQLPDESVCREQIQGVVDRSLGNVHPALPQSRENLLGRQVLIGTHEELRDLYALHRGADPTGRKLVRRHIHRPSINH